MIDHILWLAHTSI